MVVQGAEYTDHRYGHVGVAFGDLEKVLGEVPTDEARSHPERFFERYVAGGGLFLTLNHPLVTPIESVFPMARADLSWRPWTARGPFPDEVGAIDGLAQNVEAYNLSRHTVALIGTSWGTPSAPCARRWRGSTRRSSRGSGA